MKILNKPLKNLHLPDGIIIAAIHRGTEDVIIPNGDTRILEDDKVILLRFAERPAFDRDPSAGHRPNRYI